MQVMSDAAKKELHELVDALRADQVGDARERLMALQNEDADPYAYLDESDPFEDMPDEERARLHAALEQSEKELAEGKGIPAEVVLAELRARAR